MDLPPHWNQLLSESHIILCQKSVRDLKVVDVVKDQGTFFGIAFFSFEEGIGVVAPMTAWVEMVRGMVAVVEAESIARYVD